jgi:hypothetical protein
VIPGRYLLGIMGFYFNFLFKRHMVFMSCNSLGHRHYWNGGPLMELRLTWALILVMLMALDATPTEKKVT